MLLNINFDSILLSFLFFKTLILILILLIRFSYFYLISSVIYTRKNVLTKIEKNQQTN